MFFDFLDWLFGAVEAVDIMTAQGDGDNIVWGTKSERSL